MESMDGFHLEQSLPICITLAALGGIMEVGATAVTAVPAVREKEGIEMKTWVQWLALAGNVALQAVGSLFSHLIATWFGPVSLVVPFFYSATLLTNMLVFGLLGEKFTKNMKVGTYVIVVAVILLPDVGPQIQDDQDITALLHHWYSILWFGLLNLACATTGILLVFDVTKYSIRVRTIILLIARATAISVNLTVSRAFILGPNRTTLIAFIVIKIVSGAIYTYAIVVQSYAVEQARFVPLNATLIIIVNAVTGVIIWEDWRVIETWYAYICVFVLLGLGCDLLLSVPLLNHENPQFAPKHLHASLRKKRQSTSRTNQSGDMRRLYQDIHDSEDQNLTTSAMTTSTHGSRREAWKELLSPMNNGPCQPLPGFFEGDENSSDVWEDRFHEYPPVSPTHDNVVSLAYRTETPPAHAEVDNNRNAPLSSESERTLSRKEAWKETVSPLKPTEYQQPYGYMV